MSELGGAQISSLLEALPGIKSVLRSPVADAMVGTLKAAVGLGEFQQAHAEELVQFATRRSLITEAEGEKLLAELKVAAAERQSAARAAARAAKKAAKAEKPARAEKPAKAPKAKAPAKATKAAKAPKATKKAAAKKPAPKAKPKAAAKKPARKR